MKILINNKGLTIVECIVAFCLATIAAVSLVNMQTLAWVGTGKSDYLSRAAGILQRELDTHQAEITWTTTPPTTNTVTTTYADASGNTCSAADKVFTIGYRLTIQSGPPTTYLINVHITWTGNDKGIKSSRILINSP